MNKKLSITIAIPAYNEGKNIYSLLSSVLKQKNFNYRLKKILIVSDGSSDNTIEKVKKIKDTRIQIVAYNKRLGKVKRLNYCFGKNTSDVLIQLDADIKLKSSNTLSKLVQPFYNNSGVAIVYGNQRPNKPTSYIGKLAYFGFYMWEEAKMMTNAERYNCFGQITAFSKQFLNHYRLPENFYFTEDTYSFYYAKKHGYDTVFQNKACVYFNLASSIRDYTIQMNRYLTTSTDMEKLFGKELINKYETINSYIKIKAFVKSSFHNNLYITLGYIFLHTLPKLRSIYFKQKIMWDMVKTSKSIK